MKSSNQAWIFILFAIAILPINVYSKEIPERGPIPFVDYDKDGNNYISEKEFNEVRAERLSKMTMKGKHMRGADNTSLFSVFDTNEDGQLSQDELAAGQKSQMERRRHMSSGKGKEMGKGMSKNMPAFSEYDLNGDGMIMEKEFNEARKKKMSKYDCGM